MTIIRLRCEPRARAGASPAGSPSGAALIAPRSLTWPEDDGAVVVSDALPPAGLPPALPASPGAQTSSGERASRALEGLRIVIVEDDDDARDLVGIILSNAGALVHSAASAEEGFRVVATGRAQLLVSDIGMPGEDGYSLMRRIRGLRCSEGGDIPAIALSAFTRPEDRMQALRAGFTTHVAKPVHPADLVHVVATLASLGRLPVRQRSTSA